MKVHEELDEELFNNLRKGVEKSLASIRSNFLEVLAILKSKSTADPESKLTSVICQDLELNTRMMTIAHSQKHCEKLIEEIKKYHIIYVNTLSNQGPSNTQNNLRQNSNQNNLSLKLKADHNKLVFASAIKELNLIKNSLSQALCGQNFGT